LSLKGGNTSKALRVADRLHKLLAESGTAHKNSKVSDLITLSAGLSSIFPGDSTSMSRGDSQSMKLLMANVDEALNAAVEAGQNQTIVK
jgi:GGDEF domain-containing protein